jgi:hypothetical protein
LKRRVTANLASWRFAPDPFREGIRQRDKNCSIPGRTFPNRQYAPAIRKQGLNSATVTRRILLELGLPEVAPGGRELRESALLVPVPVTPMNEQHDPMARQNDVRSPGQVATVQPETEAGCEKGAPDREFRLGVLVTDTGHHPAAGFR